MIVRPPAAAGTLYEADTQRLLAQVESWLDNGLGKEIPKPPKALIVPHSGYHYSGETAAKAYRLLEPVYDSIQRVVLLGTSHHANFKGVALPGTDAFRTPLGDVKIDAQAVKQLLASDMVQEIPDHHQLEHSIEVQLPFLQTALENFQLVPLVIGDCEQTELAALLEDLWGGSETLFVVSTGFSRNLPFAQAMAQDEKSAHRIRSLDARFTYEQACGFSALNGFLDLIKDKKLDSKQVAMTNSAVINGKKDKVRGFAAFAFY